MLDDLGSYSLSDFLQYSRETYFRLFELYNETWWPLHMLALASGAAAFYLMVRGSRSGLRFAAILMAAAWAWSGWSFHLQQFAPISLAAPYFAGLFFLVAALLLIMAVKGRWAESGGTGRTMGAAVLGYALVLHPLLGVLAGRTWLQVSIFGMAPDPTAIAAVGLLLAGLGPLRWIVLIPVAAWCILAALNAYTLGTIEWMAPAAAVVLSAAAAVRRKVKPAVQTNAG